MGKSSPDWEGAPPTAPYLVGVGRWSADPQTQSLGQVAALARLGQVIGRGGGGAGGGTGEGRGEPGERGSRGEGEGRRHRGRGGGGMESTFQTGDTQLCSVGQRGGGSAALHRKVPGSSSPERKIRWVGPGWKESSWQRSPATGCHPSRLHSNATSSRKPSWIHPWLPGSGGAPGEPGCILPLLGLGWQGARGHVQAALLWSSRWLSARRRLAGVSTPKGGLRGPGDTLAGSCCPEPDEHGRF